MSYIIVTSDHNVTGRPYASYDDALCAATSTYGDDVRVWLALNLRIEENR